MIITQHTLKEIACKEAGGKGYNLYLLSNHNMPVPPWEIIGSGFFQRYLSETGNKEKLIDLICKFSQGQVDHVRYSAALQDIFHHDLPPDMQSEIEKAYTRVSNGSLISVRSSATDEDSSAASYAGQLSSYLYIDSMSSALDCLKKCWMSAFSTHVIAYRKTRGTRNEHATVAVIFQAMIDPDTSGVLFTCDPVEENHNHVLISSVYGVGEGLVSGELNADSYWVDKESGDLKREEISLKEFAFKRGNSGECSKIEIEQTRKQVSSLSRKNIYDLTKIACEICVYYPSPQDIEWAIKNDQVYILQSRPVTSLTKNISGYRHLWDNSNIVESYGGITLPLSFTFALHNYHMVYEQFCEILLVPRKTVREMDYYLSNMLGIFNGRVYYNLYNWYKLIGILPGFKHNQQFMETMMGVGQKLSPELLYRVESHPDERKFSGKWRRFKAGIRFIWFHLTIDRMVKKFLAEFDCNYSRFRKIDFHSKSSDELFLIFLEIRNVMMARWKAPIINDFLCMVHFGLLKKLSHKWLKGSYENLHNDLISGEGELESTAPTSELVKLAGIISRLPDIKQIVLNEKPSLCLELIRQSEHKQLYTALINYIDKFGFRCMAEMKLEEIDLNNDTSFMFIAIRNFIKSGTTDAAIFESNHQNLRIKAESLIQKELRGLKKWIYHWVLRHARKAVRNRENTRFARTRIYGVVRHLFQAMGKDLFNRGILCVDRDIFYLTLQEIFGIHQGTLTTHNLNALIELRKKEYDGYKQTKNKIRFETRGPVYWQNNSLEEEVILQPSIDGTYDLKGIPCCPGIVEGKIKVIRKDDDDFSLDGEIMVAESTDPGWTPLFPNAKAILVERGSLLSHSAVVAREMGIPAIVGIPGLTSHLKSGMIVRIDGKTGTIKII